ncbi:MAG TPA: HipA N-terminal domain-containing protein, partial [Planctomycetota bacterium]|nr:HipA N-terminal domain-containing protein [Planctomycetota bacterium]
MTRTLHAWFEDQRIGTFAQSDDGAQSFTYAPSWLAAEHRFAMSLSMPLGEPPFDDRTTRAFFGGLLPDDELRRRLARHLGVSPR